MLENIYMTDFIEPNYIKDIIDELTFYIAYYSPLYLN